MQLSHHLDKGAWALAANACKAVYGLLFTLWLIMVLPRETWGAFAIIQTTYLAISQLSLSFGMAPYIKYYTSESDHLPLQSGALAIVFCVAIPPLALISVYPDIFNDLFLKKAEYEVIVYFVPFLFLSAVGKLITNDIFKATHQLKEFFYTEVVYFTSNIIQIAGLYFWSTVDHPLHLLIPMCISQLLASIAGIWLAREKLVFGFRLDFPLLKRMIRFGKYTFGISTAGTLYQNADSYVIAYFMELKTVALLQAVKTCAHAFQMYRQIVALIVFPVLSRLQSQQRMQDFCAFYEKSLYYSNTSLLLLMFVLSALSGFIFTTLLPQYPAGTYLLPLFSLQALFIGWQVIGESTLGALGKPKIAFYIRLVMGAINLPLSVVLIPPFGITGAILGMLLTMAIMAILSTRQVAKQIPFTFYGIWGRHRDIFVFARKWFQKRAGN